jgi:hypothetical protein
VARVVARRRFRVCSHLISSGHDDASYFGVTVTATRNRFGVVGVGWRAHAHMSALSTLIER